VLRGATLMVMRRYLQSRLNSNDQRPLRSAVYPQFASSQHQIQRQRV